MILIWLLLMCKSLSFFFYVHSYRTINYVRSRANICLNDSYKQFKPDFGIYANGLAKRFVILVAEFKTGEERQTQENDFVKIANQMKIMLNKLIENGVDRLAVSEILVVRDRMYTLKIHLTASKTYIFTQLFSVQPVKSTSDLTLIPPIIVRLQQLKVLHPHFLLSPWHTTAKMINDPQKENFVIQSAYHNIVEVVSTMLYLQYNVYAHKKLGMNLLINRSMDLHELTHFIEFHVNSDHADSWKSIHFYYSF
ncbi:hypothetical protein BDC45DRAFT_533246 [Circinella umbellata]|nr:hypothetical protein BDC45DRAFT_533246 [Circinella umbellata]